MLALRLAELRLTVRTAFSDEDRTSTTILFRYKYIPRTAKEIHPHTFYTMKFSVLH